VLIALLFVAHATLENTSPAIVTSQRTGLPEPRYHNAIKTLANAPAPPPDMTSQAVLAAQPKAPPALDVLAKIEPAARAARAEARPTKKRVTHTQPPVEYRQSNASSHREFGLSGMN
jgi:hypothetical protein